MPSQPPVAAKAGPTGADRNRLENGDLCSTERQALRVLAQAVLDARKDLAPLTVPALDRVAGVAEQIVNPKGARS